MAKRNRRQIQPAANDTQQYNIQVVIDKDTLTWGDMFLIEKFQSGEQMSGNDMIEVGKLFDRVVVGGIRHLPIAATPEIMKAISEAMKDNADEKN